MKTINRIAGLSLAAALMLPASQAFAVEEHYINGAAVVGGYDVVAYHTDGKPMKGSSDYSATYQGATWHFASMKNQELFMADPAKYAPAYGGFCAFGTALGLITAGLLSSTFHLGHPERAWRAMSQWRSSWLSREGLVAILTYIPAGAFAIAWIALGLNQGAAALGMDTIR